MTKKNISVQTFSGSLWNILSKKNLSSENEVISELLKNRGLNTKKTQDEFLTPKHPDVIKIKDVGLSGKNIEKAIKRLKSAQKKGERVIVFGDYDADGITAAAILWETLYALGVNTIPYLPDRFSEGYGIKKESVKHLKEIENVSLIITVDNGIVATEAVAEANKLGIDVIITDHHTPEEKYPSAYTIIHSTQIGGAAVAWFFAREIRKAFNNKNDEEEREDALELAALGTIADQIPLIGPNRSIAKYGLIQMNKTSRAGLSAILTESQISLGSVRCYEVGFIIAPRINAMGRLEHGMESLRLLCTRNSDKAKNLAFLLGKTNRERQKIVEEVVISAKQKAKETDWKSVIVLSDESYHEGIIGLAAGRLVETFYRPAIVISKGEELSKASARSVAGFNIIDAIRSTKDLIVGGGGHPMAAGFTIKTENIPAFIEKLDEIAAPQLTDSVLTKKLRIDMPLKLSLITRSLAQKLAVFEPVGLGNPTPTFVSGDVVIVDARPVGKESKHLKLKVMQGDTVIDAIGFGMGSIYPKLTPQKPVSIVYSIEENVWNGNTTLQLKLKDIML